MEAPCRESRFKLIPAGGFPIRRLVWLPRGVPNYDSLDGYPSVELEFRDEPGKIPDRAGRWPELRVYMILGERLRTVREQKELSQGDIEKRSGLLRCYISRVENGHTVPAVETLEKLARALEVPMYELLYEGEEPPKPQMTGGKAGQKLWGAAGKDARYLRKLQQCLSRMTDEDRNLLLFTVAKMSKSKRREKSQ